MELQRLSSQQFNEFRDFIYRVSGIRVSESKVTLLSNRLRRRLKAGNFTDFDHYFQFLTSSAGIGEREFFLDAITTNETTFFRTPKQFQWLSEQFVPEIIAQQRAGDRPRRVRVWSAGCAVGAEPYTIAICFAQQKHRLRDWSVEILGTDISAAVLEAARQGTFKSRTIESVDPRLKRRYFRHDTEQDLWTVRPEIRDLVTFQPHNLMQPLPAPPFDCVFIRNVLIYFDRESKQTALKHLLAALNNGGYLVVGPSEGVYDMLGNLKRISPLIYQKVGDDRASTRPADRGAQQR